MSHSTVNRTLTLIPSPNLFEVLLGVPQFLDENVTGYHGWLVAHDVAVLAHPMVAIHPLLATLASSFVLLLEHLLENMQTPEEGIGPTQAVKLGYAIPCPCYLCQSIHA